MTGTPIWRSSSPTEAARRRARSRSPTAAGCGGSVGGSLHDVAMSTLTRDQVVALRIRAQQLDRGPAERVPTDAAIFDLGVQETGRDGASWALVNRGVPLGLQQELYDSRDV